MTAMMSAMIAMVRVFMRLVPLRMRALLDGARRSVDYPALPDMTADSRSRPV